MRNFSFVHRLLSILCIALFVFSVFVPSALAQTSSAYQPLTTGFPLLDDNTETNDFAGYVNFIITLIIGLAGILAVLMIIIGGIQYVSTDSWTGKDSGKKRIQAAVGGLILALSSYLILNTIDPSLTYLNFTQDLTKIPITMDANVDIGGTTGVATPTPSVVVPGTGSATSTPIGPGIPVSGSGSLAGIPYGGQFNKTLQNWQSANKLVADGKETINTLKTFNNVQYICGKGSTFGGPNDTGVSATETGAVSGEVLRSLNTSSYYIAGRWDYTATSRSSLQSMNFEVMNPKTGKKVYAVRAVDWGPHPRTGRSWDVSPGVMSFLGASTDEELCVRVN